MPNDTPRSPFETTASADDVNRTRSETSETTNPSVGEGAKGLPFVPGYEIRRELGRGGMGVVYEAEQVKARRVVALKMILTGAQAALKEIARFRAEAEALARLQHPGIVQVFDVGEADGKPYFALEYCPGGSLGDFLKAHRLTPREAARAIEELARAVDAAHHRQIVHRDLKPANVLLKRRENASANGEAALESFDLKIADFGLAKHLDALDEQTDSQAIMGTPRYMAPEQAAGGARYVGPGADVHALGAILYEMLTGRPPFDGVSPFEVLEKVRHDEPPAPRSITADVPRDLEVIALKCLRKEPHERYASAADLADDLHRYAHGEPIQARPVGRIERFVKWTRRKPALAAVYALGLLLIVAGSIAGGAVWLWREAEAQRRSADEARDRAERFGEQLNQANAQLNLLRETEQRRAYAESVRNIHQLILGGDLDRARAALLECPEPFRGWEWDFLERQTRMASRRIDARGGVLHIAVNRDGSRIASHGYAEPLRLWNALTGELVRTWPIRAGGMYLCSAFDPTGDWLAYVAATDIQGKGACTIHFWNVNTGESRELAKDSAILAELLAFSPDGRLLAGNDQRNRIVIWDWRTGKVEREWKLPSEPTGFAFTPDGRELAVTIRRHGVRYVNWQTGAERSWPYDVQSLIGLAIHPRTAKPTSRNQSAQFVDWTEPETNGKVSGPLTPEEITSRNIAYHPDGSWLASALGKNLLLRDEAGRVWPVAGHSARVVAVDFSGDGRWLVSASEDGVIRIWDVRRFPLQQRSIEQATRGAFVSHVRISPDGKRIAYFTGGGLLSAYRPYFGDRAGRVEKEWTFSGDRPVLQLSPDFEWFASVRQKTRLVLVNARNVENERALDTPAVAHEIKKVRFSEDGRWLAGWGNNQVTIWSMTDGKVAAVWDNVPIKPESLLGAHGDLFFQPDGSACAVAEETEIVLRTVPEGNIRARIPRSPEAQVRLAYSADSKWFATSSTDAAIRIRDAATGEVRQTLNGHTAAVHHVTFHPDGRRLASTGADQTIRVWDLLSGKEVLVLPNSNLTFLHFGGSAGNRLEWIRNGNLEIADIDPPDVTPSLEPLLPERVGPKMLEPKFKPKGSDDLPPFTTSSPLGVGPVAFSHDGKRLITCQGAVSVNVWNFETGELTDQIRGTSGAVHIRGDDKGFIRFTFNQKKQVFQLVDWKGKIENEIAIDEPFPIRFASSMDGVYLAVGYLRTGKIDIYLSRTGVVHQSIDLKPAPANRLGVGALAFDPESKVLATVGGPSPKAIRFWNVKTSEALPYAIDDPLSGTRVPSELIFNKKGDRLAARTMTAGSAALFDARNGKRIAAIGEAADTIVCMAFSRDGSTLATGSRQMRIDLWDAASGKHLRSYSDVGGLISALAFHPDGRRIVVGGQRGLVKVLE